MNPLTPQELSSGNLLNYDTGESIELTVIDWQDLMLLETTPDYFNKRHTPVPLTPEILEGFGFIKKEDNEYHLKYELIIKGNFILYIFNKTFTAYNRLKANFGAFKVTHAHTLQNFIQSISGVELVYNAKLK